MRPQRRNQRIIAQLPDRHPFASRRINQTEPTLHRFESHPIRQGNRVKVFTA